MKALMAHQIQIHHQTRRHQKTSLLIVARYHQEISHQTMARHHQGTSLQTMDRHHQGMLQKSQMVTVEMLQQMDRSHRQSQMMPLQKPVMRQRLQKIAQMRAQKIQQKLQQMRSLQTRQVAMLQTSLLVTVRRQKVVSRASLDFLQSQRAQRWQLPLMLMAR